MKKLISVFFLLGVFTFQTRAQSVLYGVTPGNGSGVISKLTPSTNALDPIYKFQNPGTSPYGSEFTEVNGKLYSATDLGGSFNKGVLFSFDPASNTYTKLHDLNSTCTGVLTNGNGSMIYGVTADYIFSYNASTTVFTIQYYFTSSQKGPIDGLTLGRDGKFYGITRTLLFSYDTSTHVYTKYTDLDPESGNPICGLTLGHDNNLYFNTIGGSINYAGILYCFNPLTSSVQDVHDYNATTGDFPDERMTLGNDGKLYGTTLDGLHLGTLFSFDPGTGDYQNLHDFENGAGGRFTQALLIGSNGKLYGVSSSIDYDDAILFSVDPSTHVFTVLHNFQNTGSSLLDQQAPTGKLLEASDGRFYGMVANEYQSNGNIFVYDPTSAELTTVFSFSSATGFEPGSSLAKGTDGLLYGTTNKGGLHGRGVLFSFNPANNTYKKRYDFDDQNGFLTGQYLTVLSNGKIFGTTILGGASGQGVIFSFDPASNTYTKIYDFTEEDGDGGFGLTEGNDGLLYGISKRQSYNQINIYSLHPVSGVHMNLYSLTNIQLSGKFVKTTAGQLYAMGLGDAYSGGAILSYDPQTNIGVVTYPFGNANARLPYGDLFFSSDGSLYGMTSEGGAYNQGVLFSFNTASNTITKLFDFNGVDGAQPMGGLGEDGGNLYGMTSAGGANNFGVAFSYRPSTQTFTKLWDFDGTDGGNSQFGSFTTYVSPAARLVKVNIYGGANPYNNPEWNNWNTFASLSTGNLHYNDGSPSVITAALSQQTSVSDNGPSYETSIAPREVTRYASYSTSNRTLTISGLDNSKGYVLDLYATRSGASNNTTRFMIYNRIVDVVTGNNLTVKASYGALGAESGMITLNISGLNTYNYINGFTLTQIGDGETNPAPIVDAGDDATITLPVNSIQLNGSATDANGSIASCNWTKISGPSQYSISNANDAVATVSNLAPGTYVFRLTAYDNQGASSFDDVTIAVNPSAAPTKFVKVNLYGGSNPYNHPEWNNWNAHSLSSGNLKYSDGTTSSISATLSQQNSVADNGTAYNSTMAPGEVVRYASYSTTSRTLTISGLDNSKTYNLELYASRKGATNNTTRFTIGALSVDIVTDNNLSNAASFSSLTPSGGQIEISISKLNAYNYLNGFILTESIGSASPITRKIQSQPGAVLSSSITTYPNPARDQIVLSVNNNYTGQMKVEIIDIKGSMVKQFVLSKNYKGVSRNYLPVNDLTQGEYLVRIHMGSTVQIRKLLKL